MSSAVASASNVDGPPVSPKASPVPGGFTMGDLRSKLRAKLTRRLSATPPTLNNSGSNVKTPDTPTAAPESPSAAIERRGSHIPQPPTPSADAAGGLRHSSDNSSISISTAEKSRVSSQVQLCKTASTKSDGSVALTNRARREEGTDTATPEADKTTPGPRRTASTSRSEQHDPPLGADQQGHQPPASPASGVAAAPPTMTGVTGCSESAQTQTIQDTTTTASIATPSINTQNSIPHPNDNTHTNRGGNSTLQTASSDSKLAVPDPDRDDFGLPTPGLQPSTSAPPSSRPAQLRRRQSLLSNRQTALIQTLLGDSNTNDVDSASADHLPPISANMVTRKVWVKRPGGSPTMVIVSEEDLVDDVRELILRKFANSLGRQFDAPDLALRIVPREPTQTERVLGPEEPMARTLDAYYPGGQSVHEALIIEIPQRRLTPRTSPRNGPPHVVHYDDYHPHHPLDGGTDYFGPGAIAHMVPVTLAGGSAGTAHSISVINTGQVPQIPSPGSGVGVGGGGGSSIGRQQRQYRDRPDRPRLGRQHTSSPTILNVVNASGHTATYAVATANHPGIVATGSGNGGPLQRARSHSNASSEQVAAAGLTVGGGPPAAAILPAPALKTPPIHHDPASNVSAVARTASPRGQGRTRKKAAPPPPEVPPLPAGMLSGGVPPINVLIVEDNDINLRLLEAFVKRLKVRWQTAVNGREAVNKWRQGGFHLVLMDIQLPIMSGLEATREIRRLERVNQIGVLTAPGIQNGTPELDEKKEPGEIAEEDRLANPELFKSPVIIVALTASSLQSDRHEALGAGCNDFLTKPVTYVWLERKLMEWGCMQALIDYEGWREWKSYSQPGAGGGDDLLGRRGKAKKTRAAAMNSSSSGDQ